MNSCTNHQLLLLRTPQWRRWAWKSPKHTMEYRIPNKSIWCLAPIKTLPRQCIYNRKIRGWILIKSTIAPESVSQGISKELISNFFTLIFVVEDKVITQIQRKVKWLHLTMRVRLSEYQPYLRYLNVDTNQPFKPSQNWTLLHEVPLRKLTIEW